MEHAQREAAEFLLEKRYSVLILILMEHAQREVSSKVVTARLEQVLILILMEHAQRERAYEMLKNNLFLS